MRTTTARFIRPALSLALAVSSLVGCATAPTKAPTVGRLKEDLGWSAQESVQFARFVRDFVERSEVPADGKPMLIARAAVLEQHAKTMLDRLDRYDATGMAGRDIESADLTARLAAIRGERNSLEFEWNVWQVANGVKRAEDTELRLVLPGGDC